MRSPIHIPWRLHFLSIEETIAREVESSSTTKIWILKRKVFFLRDWEDAIPPLLMFSRLGNLEENNL